MKAPRASADTFWAPQATCEPDNSVWHWDRPNGIVALNRIAEFFTDRSLALIGVAPEALGRPRAAA